VSNALAQLNLSHFDSNPCEGFIFPASCNHHLLIDQNLEKISHLDLAKLWTMLASQYATCMVIALRNCY